MTVHHDKLCYGRLRPMREEVPEDDLLGMIRAAASEEAEKKTEEKGPAGAGGIAEAEAAEKEN